MEVSLKKDKIIDASGNIPEVFYEKEKEIAVTLIALSVVRQLFEFGLVNQDEYKYIKDKYGLEQG